MRHVRNTLFLFTFASAAGLLCSAPQAYAVPPNNDNCVNALPITDYVGVYTVSGEATSEPCETSTHCASWDTASVWYKFTPEHSGRLFAHCDAPVIAVYDGCPGMIDGSCHEPDLLTCSSYTPAYRAAVIVGLSLEADQTYLIRLSGSGGSTSTYTLYTYFHPWPTNDTCAEAREIPVTSFTDEIDVYAASLEYCDLDLTSCAHDDQIDSTVWYRYHAPVTGFATISTVGSNYDTVLSVFDFCPYALPQLELCYNGGTELACSDDIAAGTVDQSTIFMTMQAGQEYFIRVARKMFIEEWDPYILNFNFNLSPEGPPVNDLCSNATIIGTYDFHPTQVPIKFANASVNEPQENCETDNAGVSQSVFYKFIPDVDGTADIHTFGSTYDTVLSVYSGCGIMYIGGYIPPALLACNNDVGGPILGFLSSLNDVPMQAGQTYIIKVSRNGPAVESGMLDFNFTFTPESTCVADIAPQPGGDQVVNVNDLLAVLQAWGQVGQHPADITGDQVVNVNDLLAVISAWGACP